MLKHIEQKQVSQAKSWRFSLFVMGGLVLLIVGALLVWYLLLRPSTPSFAPSVQYSPPQPPITLSATYEDVVKQSLAQQMHMSVAQLAQDTQANQDSLFGVADAHGVSETQLETKVLHAFQLASDQMEMLGYWSHQHASADMCYWQQRAGKLLVGDISHRLGK